VSICIQAKCFADNANKERLRILIAEMSHPQHSLDLRRVRSTSSGHRSRKRKAKEIIEASGADKPETLRASLASVSSTTFRQQSDNWLRSVKKRDVAPSTLSDWEGCLNTWLLPTSINGSRFGDLQLTTIKRTVVQELIDQMVAGGLFPKSISHCFQVVRMIFSSCVDEDGQELYPCNWKKMGLIVPQVNKKKQRRPCFTKK
jgi:hypothetical protein